LLKNNFITGSLWLRREGRELEHRAGREIIDFLDLQSVARRRGTLPTPPARQARRAMALEPTILLIPIRIIEERRTCRYIVDLHEELA